MSNRDEALQYANSVRKMLGFEPAQRLRMGQRSMASCCPVSRTVMQGHESEMTCTSYNKTVVTQGSSAFRGDIVLNIPTPDSVYLFMQEFDRGLHPDLDVDAR